MRRYLHSSCSLLGLGIALAAAPLPALAAEAVLQGLDKVTARVSTLTVPVGKTVQFGRLEIAVDACVKRPPEQVPESSAFLRIQDNRPGQPPQQVFAGWMFASSPALHPLEHAIYDIILLDCR